MTGHAGHPHAVAIGQRIRQARKALYFDVQHVARRAGIQARSLRRLEKGERLARMSTLTKLAPILQVEAEWLEMGEPSSVV